MKNIERYKDKIFRDEYKQLCVAIRNCYKDIHGEYPESYEKAVEWLFEESKYVLTQLELEVLIRLYEDGFEFIARHKNNELYGYENFPSRGDFGFYSYGKIIHLQLFKDDFKFITWDNDPLDVTEILANYIIKNKE